MRARSIKSALIPNAVDADRGYVYLIEIDSGAVKIGVTHQPRKRVYTHASVMRMRSVHFCAPVTRGAAFWIEREVLRHFKQLGRVLNRGEIITGTTRAEVLACVRHWYSEARESSRSIEQRQLELAAWRAFKAQFITEYV
jgi:hypothetical protein